MDLPSGHDVETEGPLTWEAVHVGRPLTKQTPCSNYSVPRKGPNRDGV